MNKIWTDIKDISENNRNLNLNTFSVIMLLLSGKHKGGFKNEEVCY